MGKVEQRYVDKSSYQRGEWDAEPDRVLWKAHGLDCLIRRNGHMGFLCGYVAVPKSHPLYGKPYDDADVDVHGGLSFAKHCDGDKEQGICHVSDNDDDDAWWLGFDCGHAFDGMPNPIPCFDTDAYKNIAYVTAEVESLALQLSKHEIVHENTNASATA